MKLTARLAGMIVLVFASGAWASEGLALRLTVTETSEQATHSYATAVLMKLTETVSFEQPGLYAFGIQSREIEPGRVNLIVTLKDLSEGSAKYGGGGAAVINVGENADMVLTGLDTSQSSYRVLVESSFAELPE